MLNFADGLLQALLQAIAQSDREAIQAQLPMVVRTLVQTQSAILCQILQLLAIVIYLSYVLWSLRWSRGCDMRRWAK